MKHLELIDSVILAAIIGATVMYTYNRIYPVMEKETDAIGAGATVGALTQVIIRLMGAS